MRTDDDATRRDRVAAELCFDRARAHASRIPPIASDEELLPVPSAAVVAALSDDELVAVAVERLACSCPPLLGTPWARVVAADVPLGQRAGLAELLAARHPALAHVARALRDRTAAAAERAGAELMAPLRDGLRDDQVAAVTALHRADALCEGSLPYRAMHDVPPGAIPALWDAYRAQLLARVAGA